MGNPTFKWLLDILNPFKEDKNVIKLSSLFYERYYSDKNIRYLILGINPGRFGAGITGIPFTNPKKLIEKCGIQFKGKIKYEPLSDFIYEVIDKFSGAEKFMLNFI